MSRNRASTPLHTFSESMMEENMERAEFIITKWDKNSSTFTKPTSLFQDSRHEAKEFLKSVNQLQQAMRFFASNKSSPAKLVQSQSLMQVAMKRLEKEFYQILSSNRDHLDPESVSARSSISDDETSPEDEIQRVGESFSEVEQFSTLAMSDLSAIAGCMISSGYGKECVKIYKVIRKSIIDEALYKLGVERLTSSEIPKIEWEVLEIKIKSWLKAFKIAVKSLFHGERIVCDHVFSSSDFIRESCFSDITKEGAVNLFRFPEFVSKCHKSPEKMFRMLDLYNAIAELWSDIDSIFSFDSTSSVRSQAKNSLTRLGDTIRAMLSEFESAIEKETSKTPILGGSLHPLTRYVMNYLSFLTDYSGILSDILANSPLPESVSLPESYFKSSDPHENPSSRLAIRMAWIILVLLCRLDSKAKLYQETALKYLFLTNNLAYVVQKVQNSNLRFLMGDDWVSKHDATVIQYTARFEWLGWNKVLSAIPENSVVATTMTSKEVKQCFNNFNSEFEQAYRTQSSWVVMDSKLREEIKLSIAKKLVPAYRDFYGKYRALVRSENDMEPIVRFVPDDVGNYLSDLFYGTRPSGSASSSTSSSPAQSRGKHSRR
ncbi:exocyst complex component EXO70H1-like [Macadamia integrifolia]|uniref:exocyst complex component EXO70H1-like n=1 Tax=Macadamia integrifolia TaxID=60698 RepID=UPI001C4F3EFA|nr:exocyst complex component EXO70H1-like [Macadamia integrifolia]